MPEAGNKGSTDRPATGDPSALLSAVADAWLPDFPPLLSACRTRIAMDVARFVATEFGSLAPLPRLGVRCALALLEIESFLCEGYLFRKLPRAVRAGRLDRWALSDFPLRNGLARLLRSLILLRFYDDPMVVRALESGEKAS